MRTKKDYGVRYCLTATVLGGLLTAAIVGAIKPARDFAVDFAEWQRRYVLDFISYLGTTTDVYVWGVFLVGVIDVLLLLYALKRIILDWQEKSRKNSPLAYTEDRFYGVLWRWNMSGVCNPVDPLAFCPRCDMQFSPDPRYTGTLTPLCCRQCGYTLTIPIEPLKVNENIVCQVQRKIRTGEWKQAVKDAQERHSTLTGS